MKLTVPNKPASLTDCNCSICRRYGILWAHYPCEKVHVDAPEGATEEYVWGLQGVGVRPLQNLWLRHSLGRMGRIELRPFGEIGG